MRRQPAKQGKFNVRRARRWLLIYTALLFAVVAAGVLAAIQLFGFEAVRQGWDKAQPFVIAIKWGGMFVLIWRWRDVIHWAAKHWGIDGTWRDWAVGLRWRFAGALVLLEILFGQNLLAHFL